MPKHIPPEIQRLIDRYRLAQDRLIKLITSMEARGTSTEYRKRLLAGVNEELRLLDSFALKWAKREIAGYYAQGIERAYTKFRAANLDVRKVAANQRVVRLLVENAAGNLQDANRFVGRRIADDLRRAGLDAVADKVTTGDTVKQTKINLINRLTKDGITAIRDKRGRQIGMDAYAETVARTTTREATNRGAIQEIEDIGEDLVQITSRFSVCPICAAYEGRVYSVSGKDKRYPALSEVPGFGAGYSVIHPNCRHNLVPYVRDYDDNATETQQNSNKPFEVAEQDKASVEAYHREQRDKAQQRRDRNEYTKARLAAPNEAPKTFSGYRAMKRAKSDRYKALRDKLAQ
jgi:hypothetical protein